MKKLIFFCSIVLIGISAFGRMAVYDPVSTSTQILEFTDLDPSTPFYSCGASKSIKLTIKPQVSTVSGIIRINIADASNGLFINSGSTSNNSKISIDNINSTPKQLVLNLSNVSEIVEITIPVYAAYCNLFADSELSKSISNVFSASIDPGTSLPIGQNTSFTVYKSASLLLLDPINAVPTTVRTASADPSNNNLATFQFALLNNSSNRSFDGWVSFQEDTSVLGNSFDIRTLKFILYNPSTGESLLKTISNPVTNVAGGTNNNDFITTATSINVSVPAGYKLLIREEVRINGCLAGIEGKAKPIIKWGCGDYVKLKDYENCGISNEYDTQITGSEASFQFVSNKSDYFHNTMCANNYKETKYVTYRNNGSGIAYNTKLWLDNDQWETFLVEKDPTKIYIEINGVRYTPNLSNYDLPYRDSTGQVIIYTSASQLPSDVFLPNTWLNDVNNPRRAFDHSYRGFEYDINAAMKWKDLAPFLGLSQSNWYDPLVWGHYNVSCASSDPAVLGEKEFISRLIVDEYLDPSTGKYKKINLNPGDEITIGWEQYKCCQSGSNGSNDVHYRGPMPQIKFNNGCISKESYANTTRYLNLTGHAGSYLESKIEIDSYNPTTAGNPDRCSVTQDGLVERISSKITGGIYYSPNYWQPENSNNTTASYQNWDGDLVFRMFLEQGIDLDKSLGGAITSGFLSTNGYNNVTSNVLNVINDTTGCKQITCSGCQTNKVLSPQNYYIAIRKGNTAIFTPKSVKMIDFTTQTNPAVKSDNLRFKDWKNLEHYASNLYEFRFSLRDILNQTLSVEPYASLKTALPAYYTNDDINRTYTQWVYEYTTNMMLDVDVRAYCAENSYPFFKTVSFIDKCGGAMSCDANKNGYTSMIPVAQYSGKFLVNCPGCKIPGANVNSGTLYRENMGYVDADDDGVADNSSHVPITHPNARILSNGDTMAIVMDISMSDGESKNGLDTNGRSIGVLKTELDAAGYNLDNLYVSVDHPGPSEYYAPEYGLLPLSADASIDGGKTWVPMQIIDQRINGYTLLRVNSTSFSSSKTSFSVSENVKVRFRSIMGYMTSQPDSYEINYSAGYSPSETTTILSDFIRVNGTLNRGISGPWPTTYISYDSLVKQSNTFFICTTYSNSFKYIPHYRDYYIYNGSDNQYSITCQKDIYLINRQSYSGGYNVYPNEVRNSLDTRIVEIPIPAGLAVSDLYLQNRDYTDPVQRYQHLDTATHETAKDWKLYQEYTLKSTDFGKYPNLIKVLPTGNVSFPTKLVLTFPSASVVQTGNYDADSYRRLPKYFTNHWISDTLPLIELDETYNRTMRIRLKPTNNTCKVNSGDIVYKDTIPETAVKSNLHWWVDTDWGNHYLAPIATSANYSNKYPYGGGEFMRFTTPTANMSAQPAEFNNYTLTNKGIVQVPVLVKLDYVTGANRYSAQFPYLHISGDAVRKGLVLKAVYLGNKTNSDDVMQNVFINTPYYGYNVADSVDYNGDKIMDEYVVGIDQNQHDVQSLLTSNIREPYLNYDQTYFTLVFQYNCSSCTSLIAASCSDNSSDNTCLTGQNLQVDYGYNCGNYPTINDLKTNNVCKSYAPVNFSISNLKVYVEATNFINNQRILTGNTVDVEPCTPFTYKVELNSCQKGGVKAVDVALSFPSGYTATPITSGLTLTNGKYHLDFATPIAEGTIANLEFNVSPSCSWNATDKISASVTGTAYCGQSINFPTVTNPIRFINLDPHTQSDVISGTYMSCFTGSVGTPSTIYVTFSAAATTVFNNRFTFPLPQGFVFTGSTFTSHVGITLSAANGTVTAFLAPGISGNQSFSFDVASATTCGRSFTFTGTFSKQAKLYCDASNICDRSEITTTLTPCTMTFPGGGTATILANHSYCQSTGLLTLTANPSGGIFTVDGNPGVTSINLNQVQTHTVSYALNDAAGCQYSANNYSIDVIASPQFTVPGFVEICSGSSAYVSVTAQAPYRYSWTVKGTSSPVLSTTDDLTIYPSTTTSYTVTAATGDGSCTNSKDVQVVVNPSPTLSITGNMLGCTATETCASIVFNTKGGTPRFMYYVFDQVNPVPQYAGTSNQFTDCRPGTTYSAYVLDSKGCTSTTTSFKTTRTVDYKIGDVKYICGDPNKRICIPLIAVTDGSSRVIRGLDFTLSYDPSVLRPVSTTSVGNLGTVVTGLGSATYDINTRKSGKVSVSIYYTAAASPSSKFAGLGTVICLPFDVIGSPALGTKVDITMTNYDDSKNPVTDYQLDEAYKLTEKRRCYEKGSFESIYDTHYRGRLFKPLSNLNNGSGSGKQCSVWNYSFISSATSFGIPVYYNAIAQGTTNVYGKDSSCTSVLTGPSTVTKFVSTLIPNYGLFNLPTTTATSVVEISRDIINTPANFIKYVNGFDTYLMSKITDFNVVMGNGASFIPEAHQMIAADVNMNGLVRSNDISHVQQRFIGKISEYPQVWNDTLTKASKDWRFYQTDDLAKATFKRSPSYPDENASNKSNFWRDKVPSPAFCLPIKKQCLSDEPDAIFGVLLGDVGAYSFGGCKTNLGIVDPYATNGVYPDFGDANVRTAAREASEELAYLDLTQMEKDGNVFKIPVVVNVPDTVPVFSLDMIIDFNQDNLTLEDVTLTEGTFGKANMAWNNLRSDSLILTSFASDVLPNTGAAYYLHVTSKNGNVSASDFTSPSVLVNGLQASIGVNTRVLNNISGLSGSSYSGMDIQPVPVVNQSQILYQVGKYHSGNRITITNVIGEVLATYSLSDTKGYIPLSSSDYAAGVYLATLHDESRNKVIIKKYVVLK